MSDYTIKPGLSPGTLVHVGRRKTGTPQLYLIEYDSHQLAEARIGDPGEVEKQAKEAAVVWLNLDGLHDGDLITRIGTRFGIHPLTLEDIMNTDQRPKFETYDDYLFIVLKMLEYDEQNARVLSEQVSLVLGRDFLVSFQEGEGDVFAPVRERIRKSKGRIRSGGCDYLAYALIDAVVDHYFKILEHFEERIEAVEEELFDDPTTETLEAIHEAKRELMFLRKQVWPTRELVGSLIRVDSPLVASGTSIFFRDVYDHTIQIIDTIESYRDILSGFMDIYLSKVSYRMNEIMKVLTIMATIFIPLTFVAGIYGMNFRYMPELGWRWGYPLTWVVMLVMVLLMLRYFRKNKWL